MSFLKDILGMGDGEKEKHRHNSKALILEESKKECKEIKATPKEIRVAKRMVKYICDKCGYHQGVSWDGKLRRCKSCGNNLRYNQLYERILENRKLEKESK